MNKDIILVRHRMRGDVLLNSAVIRGLKLEDPERRIYVRTLFPEIFERNPRVMRAGPGECGVPNSTILNMDQVHYEKMQGWHLIDAFAHQAGFARGTCPHTLEFFIRSQDDEWVRKAIPEEIRKRFLVVAPGPGLWEGRNWPEAKWRTLIQYYMQYIPVVVVGSLQENNGPCSYDLPSSLDLRGKTGTFSQLAAVTFAAKAWVGIDSFPCHVAGAMKTPRCVLFGLTSPECILCDSPSTISVTSAPDHPFTGKRHKVDSFYQINVTGHNPMETIIVGDVITALDTLLQ